MAAANLTSGNNRFGDYEVIPSSKTTAIDPKAVSVLPPAASSDDLHRPFSSEVVDLDSNTLGSTELSCTTALFESGIGKTDAGEGCASQEDLSNSGSVGIKRSCLEEHCVEICGSATMRSSDSLNVEPELRPSSSRGFHHSNEIPNDTRPITTETKHDTLRKSARRQDVRYAPYARPTPSCSPSATTLPVNASTATSSTSLTSDLQSPIPASLASFKNAHLLSTAPFSRLTSDKDAEEDGKRALVASGQTSDAETSQPRRLFEASAVPLRPVRPHGGPTMIGRQQQPLTSGPTAVPLYLLQDSFVGDDYEERDSYEEAPDFPYHPENWTRLPGPGLATPPGEEERVHQGRAGAA